jgi:uncharacterized LabA/DUF88 family protein
MRKKVINKKKRNIYAFIDSQNLNLGVRNSVKRGNKMVYKGWTLDFKRFLIYIKQKYLVDKAFLFIGKIEDNRSLSLYKFLQKSGYSVVFKKTLKGKKGNNYVTKGNVDAELVLHCAKIQYENYDKAIIVSGDGDFYCLIEYLLKKRKLSKILVPNQYAYSRLLSEFRQYISFISELKTKLEYKKNGSVACSTKSATFPPS